MMWGKELSLNRPRSTWPPTDGTFRRKAFLHFRPAERTHPNLLPPAPQENTVYRDKLFLLQPGFEDPAYPGQRFYCWHCALMEGVLASFPDLAGQLDIERIAWPRPRYAAIDLVGEENQSLPLLVLADGESSPHQTGTNEGRAFVANKDKILAVLSERHGFPDPHP